MIKPIKVKYTDQYGGGMVIVTILSFKRYALAQLSFSLDENCGWPWLRIDVGLNQLLSVLISIWLFTVEFNFLTRVIDYD
jgi:hypothetical protein